MKRNALTMQRVSLITLVFSALPVVAMSGGCVTSTKQNSDVADLKKQLIELQRTISGQSAQISELNNKILLLKDKIDVHSETTTSSAQNEMPAPPPQVTAPIQPERVDPVSEQATGPEKLFNLALQDSKKTQLSFLERDVDTMLKNYKESPLTNNALFLLAETQFERGQYSQGASQFEKLYKTYPDGNKAVAALYRLGLCYEKMGHTSEAKEAFQNVMTVYPGSSEALDSEKRLKAGGAKGP